MLLTNTDRAIIAIEWFCAIPAATEGRDKSIIEPLWIKPGLDRSGGRDFN